jgi:hypothetical protein
MKKIFFTGIFIIFLFGISFPQCNYFRVFHYSGKVYASSTNKKKLIVPGQVFKRGEILSLETGSQVILFDSTGNPVVLYQKGNYSFSQVQTICSESGNAITKKYFQFIWSRMTEEKKKEGNTINASVTRGRKLLMMFPADSTLLVTDKVYFQWNPVSGSDKYYITILDPSGKTINVKTVADTIFLWTPETSKLVSGKIYYWYVTDIPYPPGDPVKYSFSFAGDKQKESYSTELNELRKQLNYTPAVNSLLLAGFFEQNHLFREAYIKYREALVASPGDSVIQKTVNNFMKRRIVR